MTKVTAHILTRPSCAWCPTLKTYLQHKGVEYTEEVSWDEPKVPVTIFPDGTKQVGYNIIKLADKINELREDYTNGKMLLADEQIIRA